ncbi:MAG: transglutaminase-like cysteine peptidase [Gammaproteobacteria bacterium]|nr:transglutaminase-like cysteine peptidase [Gammaproteobacteria bacterium]
MNLLVVDVTSAPPQYIDFCNREEGECNLEGPDIIRYTPRIKNLLTQINTQVNKEIVFSRDIDKYGVEDFWGYPRSGQGDCEDKALEKRLRLIRAGIPSAALRLAVVYHKKYLNSHCVLTAETTNGTYVLDSSSDSVTIWYEIPYNIESRERVDGMWEHFDQFIWTFDDY